MTFTDDVLLLASTYCIFTWCCILSAH